MLAAAAVLLLSSCGVEDRLPGHVYYRLKADPTTLDPALVVDVTGGTIAAKLFNGLVRLGPDLQIIPDIAFKWSVSRDGLVYTFALRRGVRFSNGREVVAEDFKYSFERVLSPETRSPRTWILDRIEGAQEFMRGEAAGVSGISVIDERTLRIELSEPFSPFLGLLTMPNAYVVPAEAVRELGLDFAWRPVGTGPFVLTEWEPGRRLVLKGRDGYFDTDESAGVRGMVYRTIPEELTAVAEFELGNLDVLAVPPSAFKRYRDSERWQGRLSSSMGLNTYYLGLNNSRPPFSSPMLRRAVNMALDRARILATLQEGRGVAATGPVPDVLRAWEAPEAYPFDMQRAREMIKAAGAEGAEVRFYISAEQAVVDIAEVIQSYLKEAGLRVKITQLEWSAFKQAVNQGEADMFWLSWWADYPDPENFLYPLFHSDNHGPGGNRVMYSNPRVDALIEQGQRAPGRAERDAAYAEAERTIVRDAPWVFFWHRVDFMLRQQRVAALTAYPVYSMDKGTDVRLGATK